ncbi:MAG: MBOAT family protein, partial [Erysipelotrichaceae bacterium]|nr:MBOAT family protein [Erysipelotrichaceae bacterium]
AYTSDVYKGKIKAETAITNLIGFLTFFPTVMSGPILRYDNFIQQWNNREITTDRIANGLRRFIYGLAKKVILANQLALIVNYCHSNIPNLGFFLAWAGAICYTLQIYFDFSGYSDMALGISNMLGFTFPENFNFPYMSNTVQEFWRRWHISLSHWFRDYVYIPLGGNRVSTLRWFLNIFVVWFLTGLWHGASMNFICWGLYYGCWLVIEKYGNKYFNKIPKLLRTFIVFIIVTIGWILFRASDLTSALMYIKELVNFRVRPNLLKLKLLDILYLYPIIGISLLGCTPLFKNIYDKLNEKMGIINDLILVILLLLSIMIIINSTYSPFIYFNF